MKSPGHPPPDMHSARGSPVTGTMSQTRTAGNGPTGSSTKCSVVVLQELETLLDLKLYQEGMRQPSFAKVLSSARRSSSPAAVGVRGRASASATTAKASGESGPISRRCSSSGPYGTRARIKSVAGQDDDGDKGDGRNSLAAAAAAAVCCPSATCASTQLSLEVAPTLQQEDGERGFVSSTDDVDGCGGPVATGEDDRATADGEEYREEDCDGDSEGVDGDNGVGERKEIVVLRELLRSREEDLKMAAIIGQKLLDAQETLNAELEAAREEKWVAECQVDALKRDLEHATSQVAELQEAEDDRSQADIEHERSTDDAAELENPSLAYWSPGAGGVYVGPTDDLGCLCGARRSSSIATAGSSNVVAVAAAAAARNEVATLRQIVKALQTTNSSLEEELMEATLEATAMRRASVDWQKRRECASEVDGRALKRRSRSTGDGDLENMWPRASDNSRTGCDDTAGEMGRAGETALSDGDETVQGGTSGSKSSSPCVENESIAGGKAEEVPLAVAGGEEVESTAEGASIFITPITTIEAATSELAAAAPVSTDDTQRGIPMDMLVPVDSIVVGRRIQQQQQQQQQEEEEEVLQQQQQQQQYQRDKTIETLRAEITGLRREHRRARTAHPTTLEALAGVGDRKNRGEPPAVPLQALRSPPDLLERRASVQSPSENDGSPDNNGGSSDGDEHTVSDSGASFRPALIVQDDRTHPTVASSSGRASPGGGSRKSDTEYQVKELSASLSRMELAYSQLLRLYQEEQAAGLELQREVTSLQSSAQHAPAYKKNVAVGVAVEAAAAAATSRAIGSNDKMMVVTRAGDGGGVGSGGGSGGRVGAESTRANGNEEVHGRDGWGLRFWNVMRFGCDKFGRGQTTYSNSGGKARVDGYDSS